MRHIESYMQEISPKPGDPTFAVLKAHLLFEEVLWRYVGMQLPHANALAGARLSFAQVLALARACSTHMEPDNWMWTAISKLNRLRNALSHEITPARLAQQMDEYCNIALPHMPGLPPADMEPMEGYIEGSTAKALFTRVDMVTIALYYKTVASLGVVDPSP